MVFKKNIFWTKYRNFFIMTDVHFKLYAFIALLYILCVTIVVFILIFANISLNNHIGIYIHPFLVSRNICLNNGIQKYSHSPKNVNKNILPFVFAKKCLLEYIWICIWGWKLYLSCTEITFYTPQSLRLPPCSHTGSLCVAAERN